MGREGAKMAMISAAYQRPRFNWHSFSRGKMLSLHEIRVPHPRRAIKGYGVTNVEEKEEEGRGMRGECACIVMPFLSLSLSSFKWP